MSKILKEIKQKIQNRVVRKELYSDFTDSKDIELFNGCISSIKSGKIGNEESSELIAIYEGLNSIFNDISSDWDKNKGSLNSEKIGMHCQNLGSILKIVTIIKGLKTGLGRAYVILGLDEPALIRGIESLQKKMKEALEKMQQQSQKEHSELEKKAKEEFGKYIESGTIDEISIGEHNGCDRFYAVIKLTGDNGE